jgi:hypothetical protein
MRPVVGRGDRAYCKLSRFRALQSILSRTSFDTLSLMSSLLLFFVVLILSVMPCLPHWEVFENSRPLPRTLYTMEYPMSKTPRGADNQNSPLPVRNTIAQCFNSSSSLIIYWNDQVIIDQPCLRFLQGTYLLPLACSLPLSTF